MSLARAFAIGASGLSAQRTRMETVASNLANVNTTRTADGGPYRRKMPVFMAQAHLARFGDVLGQEMRAVRVDRIVEDPAPPRMRFEPGHPDAGPGGMVAYPNVDPVVELVDMLSATRSYEANVTAVKSVRAMGAAALDIVR